jgi:hypothetical protein
VKDSNRWFKVSILSCQICRKKADWVGLFRPAPASMGCH